jgi:hypothetical protein
MTTRLALVPICDEHQAPPAAMHEGAAARYVGMNRTAFRELLLRGIISYTVHLNGKTRIYLRSDLDAYLESLPRRRMAPRENSPKPALAKGVGK